MRKLAQTVDPVVEQKHNNAPGANVEQAAPPPIPWYALPHDYDGMDGRFLTDREFTGNADIEQQYALENAGANGRAMASMRFGDPAAPKLQAAPLRTAAMSPTPISAIDDYNRDNAARAEARTRSTIERQKASQRGEVSASMVVPQGAAYWDGKNSFYDGQGRRFRTRTVQGENGPQQIVEYATPGERGSVAWTRDSSKSAGLTPEQLKAHGIQAWRGQNNVTHVDETGRGYNQNPAAARAAWTPEQQAEAVRLDKEIADLGAAMRANPHDTVTGAKWLKARQQRGAMEGKVYSGKLQDPDAIAARNAAGETLRNTNAAVDHASQQATQSQPYTNNGAMPAGTAGPAAPPMTAQQRKDADPGYQAALQQHQNAQADFSKAQQNVKKTTTPAVAPAAPAAPKPKTGGVKLASAQDQVRFWLKQAAAAGKTPIGAQPPKTPKPAPRPLDRRTVTAGKPSKPAPAPATAAQTQQEAPQQFDFKSAFSDLQTMGWEAALKKWGPSIVGTVLSMVPGSAQQPQQTQQTPAQSNSSAAATVTPQARPMYAATENAVNQHAANAARAVQEQQLAARQTASGAMA